MVYGLWCGGCGLSNPRCGLDIFGGGLKSPRSACSAAPDVGLSMSNLLRRFSLCCSAASVSQVFWGLEERRGVFDGVHDEDALDGVEHGEVP